METFRGIDPKSSAQLGCLLGRRGGQGRHARDNIEANSETAGDSFAFAWNPRRDLMDHDPHRLW